MKKKTLLYIFIFANLLFGNFLTSSVDAQLQSFDFSGNNPDSYQCFDKQSGEVLSDNQGTVKLTVTGPDSFGNYFCCPNDSINAAGNDCSNPTDKIIAQLKPPALQQIEVWFVRILYAIWGLVASLSFLLVVKMGFDYLISRGDPTKITEVRKRIINYLIGFALVFLAVPILTTVFRLLGINESAQCYNVNMPGFQFFYGSLCTDPKGVIAARFLAAPCVALQEGLQPEGILCQGREGMDSDDCPTGFLGLNKVDLLCRVQEGDSPGAPTWCRRERVMIGTGDNALTLFCRSSCDPSACTN